MPNDTKPVSKVLQKIDQWQATGELRKLDTPGPVEWKGQKETTPLTYADPVPEATGQKNWEKLTPFEQNFAMWMPKAMKTAGDLATGWMSPDLKENLKAAWGGPLGEIVTPVVSGVGKVLSLFVLGAEGVERAWGMANQYQEAKKAGSLPEFMANLDSAWKAAHFKYDTEGVPLPWVTEAADGKVSLEFPMMGDMPGIEAQVTARHMFEAGATQEDVQAWLDEDLGALAFRGKMNDVLLQSVLDPLWLLTFVKPVSALAGSKRALLLGRVGVDVEELGKGLKGAQEASELLADVSRLEGVVKGADATQSLAEGVKISAEMLKGIPEDDIARLIEKGLLTKTEDGYQAAEGVGKALKSIPEGSSLANEIAGVEKKIADLGFSIDTAVNSRLGPIEKKFLQVTGGIPWSGDITKSSFAIQKPGSFFKPWTWFRLTPEAKAFEIIDMVGNNVGVLINGLDVDQIVKVVGSAVNGIASKEMGHMVLSLEGRSFVGMIGGLDMVVKDLAGAYAKTAPERDMLENLARFLGSNVDDMMARIGTKGESAKIMQQLAEMAKAPTSLGTDVIKIQEMLKSGQVSEPLIDAIGKMFLDGKIPYSLDTFRLHAIGAAAEVARAHSVAQFGVQAEGVFRKATNAVKSAETLMFLRTNPGYPLRNFWNNEITMWARGVWNSMGEKQIDEIWNKVGIQPARLASGFGPAESAAKISAAAAKRARYSISTAIKEAESLVMAAAKGDRNWMDKLADAINKLGVDASGKASPLDMGAFAAHMEAKASRRATTAGFLEGMGWYMKKKGMYLSFPEYAAKYHPGLDISGVPEDMLENLWKKTQHVIGESELDGLFGDKLKVGFETVLEETAKSGGISVDQLHDVLGGEMLQRLQADIGEAIAKGDKELLARSFRNVREGLQDHLSGLALNDYQTLVEKTAAQVDVVGDPTALLRIYGDGIDSHFSAWEGYLSRLGERTRDIRSLPIEKQGAAWDQFFADSDAHFGRLFDRDGARIEGMLLSAKRGGIQVPDEAIKPFRDLRDATSAFQKEKRGLYAAFRDSKLVGPEREKAWQKLTDELDQSYSRLMDVTAKTSKDLDEHLLTAVRSQNPAYEREISAWRATVRELRRGYMADVKSHYRQISGLDNEARIASQDAFNVKRLDWQRRIHLAEREGLEGIGTGQPFGSVRGVDADTARIYAENLGAGNLDTRVQDLVKAGVSPVDAQKIALSDAAAEASSTSGSLTQRLGGQRAWVDKARVPLTEGTEKANASLRDFEQAGTVFTPAHVTGIARNIKDPAERVQWLESVVAETPDLNLRKASSQVLSDEWLKTPKELFLDAEKGPLSGRWASLSAERGKPDAVMTGALEQEIKEMGYTPIPTQGVYTTAAKDAPEYIRARESLKAVRGGGDLPETVTVYQSTPFGAKPGQWGTLEPARALTGVGDAGTKRTGTLAWAEVKRTDFEAAQAAARTNARGTGGRDKFEGFFEGQIKWRPEGELPGGVPGSFAESQGVNATATSVESSFIVPGMSDRDAFALGRKYGQESVLVPGGFVKTTGADAGLLSKTGALKEVDPLETGFGTVIDVGGEPVRFAFDVPGGETNFSEPWVASMDEPNGFITMERYAKPDLKVLDPEDLKQATGVLAAGQTGHPETPALGYYLKNTAAESVITEKGLTKYTVSVPSNKIYDLKRDPEKIDDAVRAARAGGKYPVPAESPILDDERAKILLDRGYWGYRNTGSELPNAPRMLVSLEPIDPKDIGKAASMRGPGQIKPGLNPVQFATQVRDEPMIGPALDELWWTDGGEITSRLQRTAESVIDRPAFKGFDPANPDLQAAARGYRGYMGGVVKDANHFAISYGTAKRDAALLNYKARTNFDHYLGAGFPFAFWTTNTMKNWALWSMDAPTVIGEFMRVKNFTQTAGFNENLPARFRGGVPFSAAPFLPKWMGPMFANPLRFALPFDMWTQPIEQGSQQGEQIINRAEYSIHQGMDDGTIDPEAGALALAKHEGPEWTAAMEKVGANTEDTYDPFDAMSTLLAPHAPLMWAYNLARGRKEDIGPFLPVTRTIKGLTSLMGVGPAGGVNIEAGLRKAMGLPEFDKFDDYRVERMLVDMVATQQISIDDCQAAWQSREGDTWNLAKDRAGKEAGVSAVSGMMGVPIRAYPEGEQFSRELQSGLTKAFENGTEREFFQEHPEVKTRLALFDTPEERFRTFLTDKTWDTYNGLTDLEKSTARDMLGEDFGNFLAGNVNRDALDTDKAAVWLKTMGFTDERFVSGAQAAPGTRTTPEGLPSNKPPGMPPREIADQAQSYYDLRRQKFSDLIFEYQTEYFQIQEGAQRSQYLRAHPGLKAYWDWREKWLLRHPDVAPYISEKPPKLTNAQMAQTQGRPVNLSAGEWQQILGGHIYALVKDTAKGHELPEAAAEAIRRKMTEYGFEGSTDEMLQLILSSPQ